MSMVPGRIYVPQRFVVRQRGDAPERDRQAEQAYSHLQRHEMPVQYRNRGQFISHVWAPSRAVGNLSAYAVPAYYASQIYRSVRPYGNPIGYYNTATSYYANQSNYSTNPAAYYNDPGAYYSSAPTQTYYDPNYYGNSTALNPLDSVLGSLLGGGNVGLGSILGAGNNGGNTSIASILLPIAINAILNRGAAQNGLGSILTGGLPAGYLQPVGYEPLAGYSGQ